MSHLRSVTALATRGGRELLSRRNFSSTGVRKETKGYMVEDPRKHALVFLGYLTVGSLGYFAWGTIQMERAVEEVKKQAQRDLKNDK